MTGLRALCAVLALVAVGGVAGACSEDQRPAASTTTAAGPSTETPLPPPPSASEQPLPEVKTCYRLRAEDAVAPTADLTPVDCGREHTSFTYAVGRVANVVDGHLLAVDSERVQDMVASTCPERFASFAGGTEQERGLSMLRPIWFTPTVERSDTGADWYRCDVIAVAGENRLAPLRGRLAGVLDTAEGRQRFGMCGTTAPDAAGFERVICSEPHSWRAISTVALEPGPYPGVDAVRAAGQTPCEDAGATVAEDSLDYEWGYEWPTEGQWRQGQTFGRCWAPD